MDFDDNGAKMVVSERGNSEKRKVLRKNKDRGAFEETTETVDDADFGCVKDKDGKAIYYERTRDGAWRIMIKSSKDSDYKKVDHNFGHGGKVIGVYKDNIFIVEGRSIVSFDAVHLVGKDGMIKCTIELDEGSDTISSFDNEGKREDLVMDRMGNIYLLVVSSRDVRVIKWSRQ